MDIFHVDERKCERCGMCAALCPLGIILWENRETLPAPAAETQKLCINCGHCQAVCPHGALELVNMPLKDCPKINREERADFAKLSGLIKSRRSIRLYQEQAVDKDTIKQLIDTARYAPTGKNSQLLSWLVIQGRQRLSPLVEHCINWMREMVARDHPMAGDFGMEGIISAQEAGHDVILRSAPGLVVVSGPKNYPGTTVDSIIALTTFELAAQSMGLGTCWAGFFQIAAGRWPPLVEALQLPDGHIPGFAMMLGYPKFHHKRIPQRKPSRIEWRI